jgi:hypothetical protein
MTDTKYDTRYSTKFEEWICVKMFRTRIYNQTKYESNYMIRTWVSQNVVEECIKWCAENVGKNEIDWYYDFIDGLFFRREDDRIAFKLKFGL